MSMRKKLFMIFAIYCAFADFFYLGMKIQQLRDQ